MRKSPSVPSFILPTHVVVCCFVVWGLICGCSSQDSTTARSPAAEGSSAGDPQTQQAMPAQEPVELLPLIELSRDAIEGNWQRSGVAVISPPVQAARLQIPHEFPDDYVLKLRVRRVAGNDSFNIGLPLGDGRHVVCVIDGYSGRSSSLSLVDGRAGDNNPTTIPGRVIHDSRSHDIVCRVEGNSIRIACDEREIIAWDGERTRLSLESRFWGEVPSRRLMIGAWLTEFEVSELQLLPAGARVAPSMASVPDDASRVG
ncbi:MAG: hypothetical protein KDA85_14655 [Planctomycetaceae bacterium]|nr:hypothetical protein [Planctomycetaceae bacterium]